MIKLKPLNVFDFYAPTGSCAKIADYISKNATISSGTSTAGHPNIVDKSSVSGNTSGNINFPDNPKQDNTWLYVIGAVVVIGVGCYCYKLYKENKKAECQKSQKGSL